VPEYIPCGSFPRVLPDRFASAIFLLAIFGTLTCTRSLFIGRSSCQYSSLELLMLAASVGSFIFHWHSRTLDNFFWHLYIHVILSIIIFYRQTPGVHNWLRIQLGPAQSFILASIHPSMRSSMPLPTIGLVITLVPAINSAVFETRRLVIPHDRPIWLGRADESRNRSPTPNNAWFASPGLGEKNAMLYVCWGGVRYFHFIRASRVRLQFVGVLLIDMDSKLAFSELDYD
jgi:hypothetical protein